MSIISTARRRITLLGANRGFASAAERIHDARTSIAYRSTPIGRRSSGVLTAMKDKHRGDRCFVVGNGPSLNEMDLSRLRGEVTFFLNRGYLLIPRVGEAPDFLVSVNRLVIGQFAEEIARTPSLKFISWPPDTRLKGTDVVYVRARTEPGFSLDLVRDGVWEGATVTFVALQLAHWLGFHEVILIGIDHNFVAQGPAHQLVRAKGEDLNHFDPTYFGPGTEWNLPDLAMSERAYEMARDAYERTGRRIVNATLGGRLETFARGSYEELTGS